MHLVETTKLCANKESYFHSIPLLLKLDEKSKYEIKYILQL